MATNIPGPFRPKSALEVVGRVLPSLVDNTGWTPFAAAAQLYEEVELRTAFTPPVTLNVKELGATSPEPNPLAKLLKPTIILRGPLGTRTLAPYGEAGAAEGTLKGGVVTTLFVGSLVGLGFLLGRRTKKGAASRK